MPGDAFASRWARPLRVHLSVVIVLLLISIALPLIWLSHQQGKREAVSAATQQMKLLSSHAIDRYRTVFGDGYSAVSTTSVLPSMRSKPPADLDAKKAYMLKTLHASPYLDNIYVGYPDGSFVQTVNVATNPRWIKALSAPPETAFALRTIVRDDEGTEATWRFLDGQGGEIGQRATRQVNYNPTQRPWYRAASRARGPASVGPYVSASTNSLSLTLAVPTPQDPGIIAGVDVLLETMSRLLSRQAISENARGYVFDHQGKLLAHSDPAIMQKILDTFSTAPRAGAAFVAEADPVVNDVKTRLPRTAEADGVALNFMSGGVPYLGRASTVDIGGLLTNTIVIAAPLSDFTGSAMALLQRTLWISGLLLVVGVLAALVIARLISRALYALAGDARQIGNLELQERPRSYSWITEINTLESALAAAREAIRTFALYVPRELVRKIVSAGQESAAQATRQEVTVLFTDIRDFTTISEQHSPEEVVGLLSEYFELMNVIVERHEGVIVQYLGDSIYAMWNAPVADPDHVEHGCRCALALKQAIDELNRSHAAAGRPVLITRFGLHTGEAVVGSVGAQSRRQYTGMGDTINVASRLEGMNKQFGTTILVSGAVRARCSGTFNLRSLGLAQAKGRHEQVELFELVDAEEERAGAG
ncbi:adenylate/guanylate cyclase domain-containing protein [Arvimicrobium flavum]|uniref:adenylate/guanylate cyclase domain-containing protein n=1 Tax=Arvimicrobium flavum TaxID=3393320 RepID=UPI00237A1DB0|nr:adenylate/guanylate cyclase domain-containing protein [Mesorhizobium shangrilense]